MLVGILSDTHLDRPDERFLRLLAADLGRADFLVHAGDHVAASVVDHLEYEEPRPYFGVCGNMDPDEVVRRLPARRLVEWEGFTIGIAHGFGAGHGIVERVLGLFPETPDVLVFGHSHLPLVERRGGCLLVNPGSAFHPRHGGGGTVAFLEIADGAVSARIAEVSK